MATVLIGGGTGFVGGHLSRRLRRDGHEVRHLSRTRDLKAEFPAYHWDLTAGSIDEAALRDVDYLINLAGAGIADKRWSDARKKVIIESRTKGNELLAATVERLGLRPTLFVSAGAIGYYGDRGEEVMTEEAKPGEGFLSTSCIVWEQSVGAMEKLGVPTTIVRTGIVLHPEEGALEKMLLPLKFGTSTYFGDGQQYYSWIHIEDLIDIYAFIIERQLTGVYNAVSPNPVRNKPFAAALGPAMGKNALVVPAPEFALKVALGEMSHTVLDSTFVSADKIQQAGYRFTYPELSQALAQLLGK